MAGVAANIALNIKAKQTGSADLGTPQILVDIEKLLDFTPGTAAVGQANVMFSDTRTLAASATEDLDLAGLLTDALGATVAAAEIVAIYVGAAAGNTNNVNVSRPATNGFAGPFLAASDGLAIAPGDFMLVTNRNGWTVTAATGDLITITNSGAGTGVDYDVLLIGRTVAA
jgi:hypothetical protein